MNPIIPPFSLPWRSLRQGQQRDEEGNNRNVSHDGGRSLKRPVFLHPPIVLQLTHYCPPLLIFPHLPHNDYNKCEGDGFGRGSAYRHTPFGSLRLVAVIINHRLFFNFVSDRPGGSLAQSYKNWPAVSRSRVCMGGGLAAGHRGLRAIRRYISCSDKC